VKWLKLNTLREFVRDMNRFGLRCNPLEKSLGGTRKVMAPSERVGIEECLDIYRTFMKLGERYSREYLALQTTARNN